MSHSKKNAGKELPPTLRNFLTVTEADGAPRTGHVEPSALLGRLKAFLPQMAAANEELEGATPEGSAVRVERVAGEEDGNEKDAEEDTDMAVKMDLYVDESMGKLVGTTFEAEDDSDDDCEEAVEQGNTATDRPLIQVLSDGNTNREDLQDQNEDVTSRRDVD